MKKDKFNSKFREYARALSPKIDKQIFIGKIYQSFNDLFGINSCIQIGSYPRFTAITPVHDLDILYFLGNWNEDSYNPTTALQSLNILINEDYENPTDYKIKISMQTHSVTISYLDNDEEVFSVDVVPAYIFSKNEFNEDTYKVPEIIRKKHGINRIEYYKKLSQEHGEMGWIASDPRGYIKVASQTDKNSINSSEFRKTVKIIKAWKNNLVDKDQYLKLKSFHLEQVIIKFFQENQSIEIFDVIFKFFIKLPEIVNNPNQIKDRANNDKFIDDYLEQFTDEQKEKIKYARDGFLIKLEKFKDSDSIEKLLKINFYQRRSSEQFLFDSEIKIFTDPALKFKIDGFVKPLKKFSAGWLTKTPQLRKGLTCIQEMVRSIEFSIRENTTNANEYKWKVKNSDECPEPRGEITLNQTKNNPETTKYPSDSYVECYATTDNICIAKARVNVKII